MELYRHQREAVESVLSRPASALLMDAGTGKTLVAIRAAEEWARREGRALNVLLIAPLTLLRTWQVEWERCGELYQNFMLWPNVIPSAPKWAQINILAVNYERTWRIEDVLKKWSYDLVICDEGHKLSGRSSKQSKCAARLGKRAKYRLLLTGTPLSNTPLDVFGQYRFLQPSIFGTRWGDFAHRYATYGGYGGYQITGYQNLDELAEKAHSIAYRARKQDCLDLPPTTDKVIRVELDSKEQRAYDELRKHALTVLENGETCTAQMALIQLLRLQQATSGWVRSDETKVYQQTGTSKLKALLELAESQHATGRPLLVFARFVHELEQLEQALAKTYSVQVLRGSVTPTTRMAIVEAFQAGKIDVLLCQSSVGGVGLTLTATDCAVFYSVGYSLTEYEQCRARIDRIGQKLPVTYIHLVAENSVDEEVLEVLSSKRNLSELVVDDLRDVVRRAAMKGQRIKA